MSVEDLFFVWVIVVICFRMGLFGGFMMFFDCEFFCE